MSGVAQILSPSDLTGGDLQLVARGVVEGTLSGLHKSALKGTSAHFKQHRPYAAGDDLRTLDWKLYGKSDRFFVREYEDETNLRLTILLDISPSMRYGEGRHQKHRAAVVLAASLAHLMLRQQDAVGLATFDRSLDVRLPPRANPRQFGLIADALAALAPGGGDTSDFEHVFADLGRRVSGEHRRGMTAIVTDGFGDTDSLRRGLGHLRRGHNDAVVFHVLHRDEVDFPFAGNVRFDDLEGGPPRDLDARLLRARYLDRLRAFLDATAAACARANADLVRVVTDEEVSVALRAFLARRRKAGRGQRR